MSGASVNIGLILALVAAALLVVIGGAYWLLFPGAAWLTANVGPAAGTASRVAAGLLLIAVFYPLSRILRPR